MGIARSTFYDAPMMVVDDTALVEAMHTIKDEFEAYGWRRLQAALGQNRRLISVRPKGPTPIGGLGSMPIDTSASIGLTNPSP